MTIIFFRKLYNDKQDKNSVNESSTNILQIELIGNKPNSEEIINQLKKNLNYLNLKSLSSDNQIKQFNFWFDVEKKNFNNLLKDIEKITTQNKDVKIQIFSRSGIYE